MSLPVTITNRRKLGLLIAFIVLFLSQPVKAQDYSKISKKADSLIQINLPKSALVEVMKLRAIAKKNKNAPQQIQATVYRMTLQSYIEENSILAIVDSLKSDIKQAAYPVKPVLQSLLATIYSSYFSQYYYNSAGYMRLKKPSDDFTKWDTQTILDEITRLHLEALKNPGQLQKTQINVLDGVLTGDVTVRYLRPTLYDLLVHRALDFFLSDFNSITKPRPEISLADPRLFGDSQIFGNLFIKTIDSAGIRYNGIKLLQQTELFHLKQGNGEALADVMIKRLGFLHHDIATANHDSLFTGALKHIAATYADKPVSADALSTLTNYYYYAKKFQSARQYGQKAMATFPDSRGAANAKNILDMVNRKGLSTWVEEVNISNKPVLANAMHRNIKALKYMVFGLTQEQRNLYDARYSPDALRYASSIGNGPDVNTWLKKFVKEHKPVQEKQFDLPDTDAIGETTSEFKIDPLKQGSYLLWVQDAALTDSALITYSDFQVSNINFMYRHGFSEGLDMRVTDRETGKPLKGVHVTGVDQSGFTDKDGFFEAKGIGDGRFNLMLILKDDTLVKPNQTADRGYTYTERVRNHDILFTDRQIYRPGQIVYFKGLLTKVYKKITTIRADTTVEVSLRGPNRKDLNKLLLRVNEFGTYAGSFIIPENSLNGSYTIVSRDGSFGFKVEEYKRPSFHTEFLPVAGSFTPADTIKVNGKAVSFSGSGLSKATVVYQITRYSTDYANNDSRQHEIKTDTIKTDARGNFEIKFMDDTAARKSKNIAFSYSITAAVTDASGETHTTQTSFRTAYQNLVINAALPGNLLPANAGIAVGFSNLNDVAQKGSINLKLYALQQPNRFFKDRYWDAPKTLMMSRDEYRENFPDYAYKNENDFKNWPRIGLTLDTTANTSPTAKAIFNLRNLKYKISGVCEVVFTARNERGDTVTQTAYVNFINNRPVKINRMTDWIVPNFDEVTPGTDAGFVMSAGVPVYVLVEKFNDDKLVSNRWVHLNKDQRLIKVPIGLKDTDISVQFTMVYQNRQYTSRQHIEIKRPLNNLAVKLLTFRNKLSPGQKEQWKLQFSLTGGQKANAEVLAGLYDAALDDLYSPYNWHYNFDRSDQYMNTYYNWYNAVMGEATRSRPLQTLREPVIQTQKYQYEQLNLSGYNYFGGANYGYQRYMANQRAQLSAMQHDMDLESAYKANAALVKNGVDVIGKVMVVEGYPLPGATVSIRGKKIYTSTNSSGNFKINVAPGDTLQFTFIGFNLETYKVKKAETITVALKESGNMVMKETVVRGYVRRSREQTTGSSTIITSREVSDSADLQADRSRQAADIAQSEEQNHAPRKNFNETAFFYPQLHTDDAGEVTIDFTIPESLTKWRFRAFAHTKTLQTGYVEREIVTQKQLSVSANTPRFLRMGDTITISARVANLTNARLKGKVHLQLFNALNTAPVKMMVNERDTLQSFSLDSLSNQACSFRMIVPKGLDGLTYRLIADAGAYSDGEENTLPIISNQTLVTESVPMMVRGGQTKTFTFDKLINQQSATLKNKTFTLEYTQNPTWYAVQALPYMMEYPYECAEQLFSRFYANALAANLVNTMPVIKQVFNRWQNTDSGQLLSNLDKNQELKASLMAENPWLQASINETEQKKRIALLFDMNKMGNELQNTLSRLQHLQLEGGGFPWFGGNRPDVYITTNILAGCGQLLRLDIPSVKNDAFKWMVDRALRYTDDQLVFETEDLNKINPDTNRAISPYEAYGYYTRSFFNHIVVGPTLQVLRKNYLDRAARQWVNQGIYQQGLIALTMLRNNRPDVAAAIIKSLKETAQQSEELGMYWAKNQQGYYWYQSPVETQSLMVELFTEAGNNDAAVDEMKIWLLRNKQTNNWKTTKATVAACYALLMKGSNILETAAATEIKIGGKPLTELRPDIKAEAGSGYSKISWPENEVKPALGRAEISNKGKTISWGAMYWQYLEDLDKITPSQTDLRLERKYYLEKQTANRLALVEVDRENQPRVGDLLKVVVTVKAGRDFEYIELKDMRPSGTEPVDVLSSYRYQNGLYYYQVTKDLATIFFISNLNKGSYVFQYQLRVAQPGNFSTGISTVQSMYAPEFNAHSEGARMIVKP